MPMPTPRDKEEKNDFIDRCMGDETMVDDFEDPAQRRAVCEGQWDDGQEEGQASAPRYMRVLQAVQEHPWAILPERLEAMLEVIRLRVSGQRFSEAEIAARVGAAARPPATRAGLVQVLPLWGILAHRMNLMTAMSGGTSLEQFGQVFRAAVADPALSTIVLDIDSPGGSVFGVDELAAEIHAARDSKRIIAVANAMCASAAYWLATQAHEVVITPSGQVGAIGILAVHQDVSQLEAKLGVKTTLISAGRFKADETEFAPLSAEARAAMQARVDEYYDRFIRAVARGRSVAQAAVREGFGEGRMVGAKAALREGLVDRVEPFGAVLSRLGLAGPASAKSVRAESSDPGLETRRRRLRQGEVENP